MEMQADQGISLEAQRAAIEQYCALHGLQLVKICQDVLSGAKEQRPGLQDALRSLDRGAAVLVMRKLARVSRSIRHFCELYDRHFKDGAKELVAIRETSRLDSALGRALISVLLVFALMEREATGERMRLLHLGNPSHRREVRRQKLDQARSIRRTYNRSLLAA